MNAYQVIFEQSKYNFVTSINGDHKNVADYYVGNRFNMGGISYDHDKGQEIEVDDVQVVQNVAQVVDSDDVNADDLVSVRIFDPVTNKYEPAIYSPKFGGVIGFVGDKTPYFNAYVLSQEGDPFVSGVSLLVFPTHCCHDNVHRLLVERGKMIM